MKKPLLIVGAVIGVLLIILSVAYCVLPANALPTYVPGYDPSLAKVHYKHGLASLALGVGLLAYASFSGRRSSSRRIN